MYQDVDRSQTQFYPHDRYHPRYTQPVMVRPDWASILVGVMKDDGPRADDGVRLPDVPFEIIVPANLPYYGVNLEVWRRLEAGESLIGLDFTPPTEEQITIPTPTADWATILLTAGAVFGLGLLVLGSRRRSPWN